MMVAIEPAHHRLLAASLQFAVAELLVGAEHPMNRSSSGLPISSGSVVRRSIRLPDRDAHAHPQTSYA
jgi:hypothetical protein